MAKIIDFYLPDGFQKRVTRIPPEPREEVIEIVPAGRMDDSKVTAGLHPDEAANARTSSALLNGER